VALTVIPYQLLSSRSFSLCILLSALGNGSLSTFSRQRRFAGASFCAVHAVSKENICSNWCRRFWLSDQNVVCTYLLSSVSNVHAHLMYEYCWIVHLLSKDPNTWYIEVTTLRSARSATPSGTKFSCPQCWDWLWGRACSLCNGYRLLVFPKGKVVGAWIWLPAFV
jgi:hypothetical protein